MVIETNKITSNNVRYVLSHFIIMSIVINCEMLTVYSVRRKISFSCVCDAENTTDRKKIKQKYLKTGDRWWWSVRDFCIFAKQSKRQRKRPIVLWCTYLLYYVSPKSYYYKYWSCTFSCTCCFLLYYISYY